MPKKFVGENSKAAAAKAKKAAVKEAEDSKRQKESEDAYWKDEDKQIVKKQQRKEEQEKKKLMMMEKKAEKKALLEQEMESIKMPTKIAPPSKVTRAQINENKVNVQKKEKDKEKEKIETHLTVPLEENINRITLEGEEARTVTEAIAILSDKSELEDKHPEKRMKAAYTTYETKRIAELKVENPSLRLSQLKQMIFKEWQKSPENPLNIV